MARTFKANARARYRFQTVKRCRRSGGMGNRLSCYYRETTGTPDRHHRFLSPEAFSLKYETISSYYGEFPTRPGGREEAARRVYASRQQDAIDVGCPDIPSTRRGLRRGSGLSARRIANCQTRMRAVSLRTLLLSQAFHVGDRARVPRRKQRSHRCSAAAGDEPCRGSRSRLGFLVEHSMVFRRRTIILHDQKGAARNRLPRCQHQIGHHRWKQQSLSALSSRHHCCCW
jgi:hypothetical protein